MLERLDDFSLGNEGPALGNVLSSSRAMLKSCKDHMSEEVQRLTNYLPNSNTRAHKRRSSLSSASQSASEVFEQTQ